MTPESMHDLFLASASTAGALIGLLFVAVSIAHERLTAPGNGLIHRIRATAALTSFTNSLAISLFALLPDGSLGTASTTVGCVGLAFISGSLISVIRHLTLSRLRELTFLVFLASVCVQEVIVGQLFQHSHDLGDAEWLGILVIVLFLIGIQRAWELIGGPEIGLRHEVFQMMKGQDDDAELGESLASGPAAVPVPEPDATPGPRAETE